MDTDTKALLGSIFTSVGVALGAGGTPLTLAGLPSWAGALITIAGICLYAVGNGFKHSVTGDHSDAIAANTASAGVAQMGFQAAPPAQPTATTKTQ